MYKIAILGDRDSIYGFATLGMETFPVDDIESGERTLKTLAAKDYAIIYITEDLMAKISDEVAKYNDQRLPAIIPIPGVAERNGAAMENLQKLVIQAVGSDIFGND
ncbi:MAG: V-type ATP synthase subunit F [Lachnospiraceae bacterium]|nr:V-type ATP synthase subunit F [Lachnospiraceae bacterium]